MKRILSLLLALTMCISMAATVFAEEMTFTDVFDADWYYEDVKYAVENGLINGRSKDKFAPDGMLTYAETIKLAACMNQLYNEGAVTIASGEPWYQPYVDYCREKEIIADELEWTRPVSRSEYIAVFAKALPEEAFEQINNIPDGSIPDVNADASYYEDVYKMYRAGIVTGSGEEHRFMPNERIKRAEVAAILARMMDPERRVPFEMGHYQEFMITTQPEYANVAVGGTAVFKTEVSGGKAPYTRKWEKSKDGENWVDLDETDNATRTDGFTLTLNDVKEEQFTNYYMFRCTITDSIGTTLTTVIAKLVKVEKSEETTTDTTTNITVSDVTISTEDKKDDDTSVNYTPEEEWGKFDPDSGKDYDYYETVEPDVEWVEGSPGVEIGTVAEAYENLVITTQPTNATFVSAPARATFTVEVGKGKAPYKYQWEMLVELNGSKIWKAMPEPDARIIKAGKAPYIGANTNTLTVAITEENAETITGGKFRCVITDASGKSITTNEVSIVKSARPIKRLPISK